MKMDPRFRPELCASQDDSRYSLLTPWLDPVKKRVVATNGHMLVAVPVEDVPGHGREEPVGPLQLAMARKGEDFPHVVGAHVKYPAYEQVVPTFRPGSPGTVTIGLSAEYLRKIAEALGADKGQVLVTVSVERPFDPLLVTDAWNGRDLGAYGLLMPVRFDPDHGVQFVPPAAKDATKDETAPAPVPKPITDEDLPEYLMSAMSLAEQETYLAGEHRCAKGHPSPADMPLPSTFGACETHGPRTRAAMVMLHHRLAEYIEDVVERCAQQTTDETVRTQIRALAPRCTRCLGTGLEGGNEFKLNATPCPACSRGKATAHWDTLPPRRAPAAEQVPPCGGSRCHLAEDGVTWIHSSKSYATCSVRASDPNPA